MINGKVARILNEYQLVLNVGYADGVKKGMLFVIYEPGDEITDPESGESLGSLELVKGEVAVSHVQETISIAQSKEIENKSTSTVLSARLAEITPSAKSHFEKNFEKLDVRRSDISGTSTAGPITVGDLARSVED